MPIVEIEVSGTIYNCPKDSTKSKYLQTVSRCQNSDEVRNN